MYDKFEQLAFDAQPAVAIFANEPATDWVLVGLNGGPLDSASVADLNRRGLTFAGVTGLVGGQPRTCLDRPLGDATVDKISALFVGYFVARFVDAAKAAKPKDDSEAFLWRLWALKDPRPDA